MRILTHTLFFCLAAIASFANPINLPSTGQSVTGVGISNRDAHYSVTIPGTSTNGIIASSTWQAYLPTFVDSKWQADAPWITPYANGLTDLPAGVYTFSVTFELPANIQSIVGNLLVDDRVQIYFNGRLITELPTDAESGYWAHTLSTFTITNGFLTGTNRLEFRVFNTHANTPVGLAVSSLQANPAPVPEPATLLLLGVGLAGLGHSLRRTKGV